MIDLATLCAFLAAADLVIAAMVGVGIASRPRDGVGEWSASLGARALAFGVFATHPPGEPGALAAAGALLAAAMTLQAAALLAFDRRTLPVWVHTAVIAAVAVPFALVGEDAFSAIVFGGLVFATLLAALAVLAWQTRRPGGSAACGFLAACYGFAALAFLSRAVAAAFVADPAAAFRAPADLQAAAFLGAAVAALASSFAFVLMHKERAEAQALRLATLDTLTGAYNRRTFHEIAEREMARARRGENPLSLILVDIDHFRALNDANGHRVGDAVLQRFAAVVRAALREEDVLVRYAGAQFIVLLPDVPGPGAVVVAGRLRTTVAAAPFDLGDASIAVTMSAGVAARLDEGPESIDALIGRADDALALAKRRGRNRVVALSLGRAIAA